MDVLVDESKFYLVMRPSGRWAIRYWINGKEVLHSTKQTNYKLAERIREEFIASHSFVPLSLSQLLLRYLSVMSSSLSPKSAKNYSSVLRSFLSSNQDKNLNQYKTYEFDVYFSSLLSCRSPYTVHLHKRCLNALFSAAINWGYLSVNPLSRCKRFKLPEPEPLFYTTAQFSALLSAVDSYSGNGINNRYHLGKWKLYYKDLFTFAVLSGLRFNEIQHLRPEHIDPRRRIINVFSNASHTTKDNQSRAVEMHSSLLPIYERRKHLPYLFLSFENKPLQADRISKQLKKFNAVAGNPPFSFIVFRSTFGMWLIQASNPIEYVSAQLGHSSILTTQKHYAKWLITHNTGRINSLKLNL